MSGTLTIEGAGERDRPQYELLKSIATPAELRLLERSQLPRVAEELRNYLVESVSQTGGHLSSNLGTVELTIALHYVFDTPHDRLVWDVGHQTYGHKILTGRRDAMKNLRMWQGLAGFPRREESEYDTFGTAHSSTSISAALGMAVAAKLKGEPRRAVAIIGDGAMTAGMVKFAEQYPKRYFDVGIAEQHAVTFAAGIACEGYKPVVAIYSTFLQRGYDQLIHDVQIQNLPVIFALDRGGLVGADGATHNGSFDLSYLRCLPNMTVMTPADENECRQMLFTAFQMNSPVAVRYPRGSGPGVPVQKEMTALPVGRGEVRRRGAGKVAILVFGSMLAPALAIADEFDATVANMRFVKPLDVELVRELAQSHDLLVTVEENVIMGGAGSAVLEALQQQGCTVPVLQLGLPDRFIDQGDPAVQLASVGLDAEGIALSIRRRLETEVTRKAAQKS